MRGAPTADSGGAIERETTGPVGDAETEVAAQVKYTVEVAVQEGAVPRPHVRTLPAVVVAGQERQSALHALLEVRRTHLSQAHTMARQVFISDRQSGRRI